MAEATSDTRRAHVTPEWLTLAATGATAGAYVAGHLQISFFASGLGVPARDLALDFRDYVMLAVANIGLFALPVTLFWLYSELDSDAPLRQRVTGSSDPDPQVAGCGGQPAGVVILFGVLRGLFARRWPGCRSGWAGSWSSAGGGGWSGAGG